MKGRSVSRNGGSHKLDNDKRRRSRHWPPKSPFLLTEATTTRSLHLTCQHPESNLALLFSFPSIEQHNVSSSFVLTLRSINLMAKPHVLLIPYPAQGHMLPLLDLAHLLSHRHRHDVTITIAVTTKNLPLLSPLLSSAPSIEPLVLPFPKYPSLPPDVENTKDVPHSVPAFFHIMHALSYLHDPILTWARSVSNPPTAIISDFFLGWTVELAGGLGIPRITFCPSGALALSITNYLWRNMPEPGDVSFETLPGSPVYTWYQLSTLYRSYAKGDPLSESVKEGFVLNMRSWGFVFNTFEGLEASYLNYMRKDLGHDRVWAVGPLSLLGDGGSNGQRGGASSVEAGGLMTWLDGKDEGSVLYICFGSQATLSQAQADALAAALERSGAQFVWCMRADAAGPAPEFEERIRGKGVVMKGWAPQVEVLGHVAVGWFLTHCGWNSTLEGIAAGVGMLTWPMGADQYYNARVVEEEVGTGVRACSGRETVPDVEELRRVLMQTAVGKEGEERKRAKVVKEKAMAAVREGGSSLRDVDALVEELNKSAR